jgi:hypothetical protein
VGHELASSITMINIIVNTICGIKEETDSESLGAQIQNIAVNKLSEHFKARGGSLPIYEAIVAEIRAMNGSHASGKFWTGNTFQISNSLVKMKFTKLLDMYSSTTMIFKNLRIKTSQR